MGSIEEIPNLNSGLNSGNQTNQVIRIDYNYLMFLSSMRVALMGRNTLGMIDGICSKGRFPNSMGNHRERVNVIVLSWLMNSVAKGLLGGIMYTSSAQTVCEDLAERFNKVDDSRNFNLYKTIATLTQGSASVSVYFSNLKDLWEEFEALVPRLDMIVPN
ncbi:uncharacterized protein [Nicotiana tomentosiformis]|uniref:uncharacterized protein n=1 Tax=Nicotiana tomentosiformis TaxID=4098 RepID=UPI00388CC9AF